jgi:murein DD-endopeptidase MepM/ murein hydrolase activator NlpD
MRSKLVALALVALAPGLLSAEATVYVLRRGDTLYSIARRFDVPLELLMRENGITDPSRLSTGTRIVIPEASGEYRVRRGDTLYRIAQRHGLSVADLRELNGLPSNHVIKVGDLLKVPEPPDAQQGQSQNASAQVRRTTARAGTPFWPHPGRVVSLDGRLSAAVAIEGKEGDPILSVSAGTVTWAAPFRGYGRVVFVRAANGVTFGYAGNGELLVGVGDEVTAGTTLGRMGVHAHDGVAKVIFFATRDEAPLDPFEAPRS